ncbi:hypothetical protein [Natronorubrum sulfidifaciens]|uniref:Uncharacterized protein n=1 Tax=Natronorubrum sulfidifaciens JCM 14089 TaxID=1230460 RepID=L9W9D8_9EURY|nr:hypothetical protein [Natronorubrum sulfidifaciens]ELY46090.1 hypothetical protein C495_07605 [Natronorubrum sulfidifaciens JCM 14089]
MPLGQLLSGDPSKNSKLYLAIGGLSLVKAIVIRKDRERFRRELLDAGLFIGAGLVLRRYSQLKAEKRDELEGQVPDWAVNIATSEPAKQRVRTMAQQRLGSQPEPEPTLRERARAMLSM